MMAGRFAFASLAALLALASAEVNIVERPMKLYSSVSPKLRIQTDASAFAGILEQNYPTIRSELEAIFDPFYGLL